LADLAAGEGKIQPLQFLLSSGINKTTLIVDEA
jgi:hypothetical protein